MWDNCNQIYASPQTAEVKAFLLVISVKFSRIKVCIEHCLSPAMPTLCVCSACGIIWSLAVQRWYHNVDNIDPPVKLQPAVQRAHTASRHQHRHLKLTAPSGGNMILSVFKTFRVTRNRPNKCNSYLAYISFLNILKKYFRYKSGPYFMQSVWLLCH